MGRPSLSPAASYQMLHPASGEAILPTENLMLPVQAESSDSEDVVVVALGHSYQVGVTGYAAKLCIGCKRYRHRYLDDSTADKEEEECISDIDVEGSPTNGDFSAHTPPVVNYMKMTVLTTQQEVEKAEKGFMIGEDNPFLLRTSPEQCTSCRKILDSDGLALALSLACTKQFYCRDCLLSSIHQALWIDNNVPGCPCCQNQYMADDVQAISGDLRDVNRYNFLLSQSVMAAGMPFSMQVYPCPQCLRGELKPVINEGTEAADQCPCCDAVYLFKRNEHGVTYDKVELNDDTALWLDSGGASGSAESFPTDGMCSMDPYEVDTTPASPSHLSEDVPLRKFFVEDPSDLLIGEPLEDTYEYDQHSCEVCFDGLTKDDLCYLATLKCRAHWICRSCYQAHITFCVREKRKPQCPACETELDTRDMLLITGNRKAENLQNDHLLDQLVAADSSFFVCTKPDCGMYALRPLLKVGETEEVHCDRCMAQYHFYGAKGYHYAQLLDREEEKKQLENYRLIVEQVKKGTMKLCPKCKTVIERTFGCARMVCRQCNHQFCWVCQNTWGRDGYTTHARCSMETGWSPFAIKVVTIPGFDPKTQKASKCSLM